MSKKEKKASELEDSIRETKERIQKMTIENEKLSQEAKQLKAMIPKKTSVKDSSVNDSKIISENYQENKKDMGIDDALDKFKENNIISEDEMDENDHIKNDLSYEDDNEIDDKEDGNEIDSKGDESEQDNKVDAHNDDEDHDSSIAL